MSEGATTADSIGPADRQPHMAAGLPPLYLQRKVTPDPLERSKTPRREPSIHQDA